MGRRKELTELYVLYPVARIVAQHFGLNEKSLSLIPTSSKQLLIKSMIVFSEV